MGSFYITVRIYSSLSLSFLALVTNSLSCFVCSDLENKSLVLPSKFSSLLGKWKKNHFLLSRAHPAPQKALQSPPCACGALGPLITHVLVGTLMETALAEAAMEGGHTHPAGNINGVPTDGGSHGRWADIS